jgi:hypothetical protein
MREHEVAYIRHTSQITVSYTQRYLHGSNDSNSQQHIQLEHTGSYICMIRNPVKKNMRSYTEHKIFKINILIFNSHTSKCRARDPKPEDRNDVTHKMASSETC